jgi:hypothetical protein
MTETTSATVATPRAGAGDSAAEPRPSSAEPITTATVAGESAEQPRPKVKDHASRVLKSLTPTQLKEWKQTGNLPDGVTIAEDQEFSGNENEALLAQLNPDERKAWRETGELPERVLTPAEKRTTKAEEPTDKEFSALAEKSESPLARAHALTTFKDGKIGLLKGREADADAILADARKGIAARLEADRKGFAPEDTARVMKEWTEKIDPAMPAALKDYFRDTVQPLLHSPWKFFRAFTLDANFRREVVQAGFAKDRGNVDKMLKVIARFDAKNAPERKPLRIPPSPASRVGGKATGAVDEERAALESGDFARYRREANRQDHLRRTGRVN